MYTHTDIEHLKQSYNYHRNESFMSQNFPPNSKKKMAGHKSVIVP